MASRGARLHHGPAEAHMEHGRGPQLRSLTIAASAFAGCGDGSGESVLPEKRWSSSSAFDRGDGQRRRQPDDNTSLLNNASPSPDARRDFAPPRTRGGRHQRVDAASTAPRSSSRRHAGIDNYDIFIANLDGSGVRLLTVSLADDVARFTRDCIARRTSRTR
jgi:hypothetical protein